MAFLSSFFQPAVIFATVAPIAVWFVDAGWIDAAHTIPFFMVGLGIPAGLVQLVQMMQHLYEARQAAVDTAAVLSIPPMPEGKDSQAGGRNAETKGSHAAESGNDGRGEATADPRAGGASVRLTDVVFGYDPESPIIRGVSFEAPAGSVTALVGPSGGGKTTLARLIARFYDVDIGSVTIDGKDVRDTSFQWLLSRVAIVLQDVALAHDTVAANIALGKPDATQAQIEEAARAAQIHDRILRLPRGYDTVIGEKGGLLSGGERQRLTIARAYIQDAPILILDEATAQSDPRSEREIHRALTRLSRGRTVIVIAHRLATIAGADAILTVVDGKIAERGTHEELLRAGGVYADMWKHIGGAPETDAGGAAAGQEPAAKESPTKCPTPVETAEADVEREDG